MASLLSTTIRDFGGGWNASDSDLNLSSRYQPISDNVVRGIDGSFSVRMGSELWSDFETGTETDLGLVSVTFDTVNTNPKLTVNFPAPHGLASGGHITISGLVSDIAGIDFNEINGTHSVLVVDADTITFNVTQAANATASTARDINAVVDDHLLGGNIIHNQYFNRRLLVFTDIGEVGTVDDQLTKTRIWGAKEAELLTAGLVPTRRCRHWSSDTFKSTVVACNGYDKDKPIQIADDFTVEFLIDKATLSNASVPKADYVVCLQGYVVFIRTEFGNPYVEMSAKGTDGTFTREASPADAVEVDLSMITSTVEPVLLGGAPIRDKLFVAFYDKGMVGELGIYDSSNKHQPNFSDTIAENGTISHRTMVSLGNDIFMCDYAGVPSVSISQASGIFVPVRVSELIAPPIQRHLSSLSEDTLRTKAFALFNRSDRSYMLFLPIYDETTSVLDSEPFLFNDDLRGNNQAIVRAANHRLFEDSYVTVAGSTDIGDLPAASVNGKRRVACIIDDDNFVIDLGGAPSSAGITFGGGSAVTITPVNNETIGYIFEYNKEFKLRRWTRYRYWNFACGCSSQRGKVFFAKGLKVYRMGDNETPLHADFIGDYDYIEWTNNFSYTAGERVRDQTSGAVFVCNTTHVSPAAGTFEDDRNNNLDLWSEYKGNAIKWALETPWSDMKERSRNKVNKYVNLDTEGYDKFTLSVFTNRIRHKPTTNELIPVRSLEFIAGDAGGWGIQNSGGFGGSRRTREEKVWPFQFRGKLVRWRYSGETTKKLRIISHTMYYMLGKIR